MKNLNKKYKLVKNSTSTSICQECCFNVAKVETPACVPRLKALGIDVDLVLEVGDCAENFHYEEIK